MGIIIWKNELFQVEILQIQGFLMTNLGNLFMDS